MTKTTTKLITLGFAAVLVAGVATTAVSAGRTGPARADLARAGRTIRPPEGATDERVPLPPGDRLGAPGVVEPKGREVRVAAEAPGVVAEVLVREGERVSGGAPLVLLRAATEEAQVAAAEADLEAARAQLAKVLRGARAEEVDDADAQAWAARARAEQSALERERVRALWERGAASRDDLDRASAQAEVDARTAAAAEARRRAVVNGSRREDVALARAAVAQAEARLAQARALRDRLVIRAPRDGEILEVHVRPGEYVNPAAQAVVTLGDTSAVRVRVQVDERDVARVAVGQRGWVQADAFGQVRWPGRVVEVGRRMGRKKLITGEPGEKLDTQVLEVVMELDGHPPLVQGLRVTSLLEVTRDPEPSST